MQITDFQNFSCRVCVLFPPPILNYFSYFLQMKLFAKSSQLLNSAQIFLFSVDRFPVKTNPFSHLRLGIMAFTSDTVRKKSACGQLALFCHVLAEAHTLQ